MNKNLNFHTSNDLNVSNSSDLELNDIPTEDLFSYSEDKSQTINNFLNNNNNELKLYNNNLQEKNKNNYKNENQICSNNSEITISFLSNKNKNKITKNNVKMNVNEEKSNKNGINGGNNENGSNKDLSSLQVSLSNLLSDIDSKEIFFNQNNKLNENISNNNIDKINKNNINNNNNVENVLIHISNEKVKNYNRHIIEKKNKNNYNEDHSSSVCNYSHSLHTNNASLNNDNKNHIYISNFNPYTNPNKDKNTKNKLKYIKFGNTAKDKPSYNELKKINNNIKNIFKLNNNSNIKLYNLYQIEKGENIQLLLNKNNNSINNTFNDNFIYNYNNSKLNSVLSINKTQNFTINSSTFDYNNITSEYYDKLKKTNINSTEIIKENFKSKTLNEKIGNKNFSKNKIKLINNKNIEILKEDSKKFFYNPKKKQSNELYINKIKAEYKQLNKIKVYNPPTTDRNNKKEKNFLLNNCIKEKDKNKFSNENNSYTYNNYKNNNKNFHKINKIENKNKLFYLKDKKKNILNINNHYNSINKKLILKVKTNTRNFELNEMNSRKNHSIAYNKKDLDINLNINKINNKYINDNCSTEPIKYTYKKKYNKNTISNSFRKNLINKIKHSQIKTTNKLLNKLRTFTNLNIDINNINKNRNIKGYQTSTKNKNQKFKDIIYKAKTYKVKRGISMSNIEKQDKKVKINKIVKVKKNNNYLTDNIYTNKEKKGYKNYNQHKKLNSQIYLTSLLNNFYNREKNGRKNNKTLFNFGNIYFINQTHLKKGDDNKDKIILLNDSAESKQLNTLNYSIIKQKPQIINDFSNYKRKGNLMNNCNDSYKNEINGRNINTEYIKKRVNTDISDNIKNNFNIKIKIKDSFKLKRNEGDSGKNIIKEF